MRKYGVPKRIYIASCVPTDAHHITKGTDFFLVMYRKKGLTNKNKLFDALM